MRGIHYTYPRRVLAGSPGGSDHTMRRPGATRHGIQAEAWFYSTWILRRRAAILGTEASIPM